MVKNMEWLYVSGFITVVIAAFVVVRRITVYEYERAVGYRFGRYVSTLDPGQYWYFSLITEFQKVDVRPRVVSVPGQEVLTADAVSIKVSLLAQYRIAEPAVAVNAIADAKDALYATLQFALRETVGALTADELLEKRGALSAQLRAQTAEQVGQYGLALQSVGIKDIMFAGGLKEAFAQVVTARKEGQAALERARGESAALRNLANAARLMHDNPALLQLRLVQALSESSGHTFVLGLGNVTPPFIAPRNVTE